MVENEVVHGCDGYGSESCDGFVACEDGKQDQGCKQQKSGHQIGQQHCKQTEAFIHTDGDVLSRLVGFPIGGGNLYNLVCLVAETAFFVGFAAAACRVDLHLDFDQVVFDGEDFAAVFSKLCHGVEKDEKDEKVRYFNDLY